MRIAFVQTAPALEGVSATECDDVGMLIKESHVSPSQIEKWDGCQRAWAYSRVRERTQGAAAAFGDRAHNVAEAWLRDGTPPDPSTPEGACILAGLEYLPMPGTCAPELEFTFWSDGESFESAPRPGTVKYTGKIDFPYGYQPGQVVIIGDHKTTGDVYASHVKTPDKLEDDPQRIIYSFAGGHLYQVPHVLAHWQYYQRKPPKARPPIVFGETLVQISRRFRDLHHTRAVAIRDARDALRRGAAQPSDFPRSLDYCNRFGRCPYMGECHADLSPLDVALAGVASVLSSKGPAMTQPNIVSVLQANAQQQQAPAIDPAIRTMIRDPSKRPPGMDAAALAKHYGIEAELDADAPVPQPSPPMQPTSPAVAQALGMASVAPMPVAIPQQQAAPAPEPTPEKKPKRKRRTNEAERTATAETRHSSTSDEGPFKGVTLRDKTQLLIACASGGLDGNTALAYQQLLENITAHHFAAREAQG